MQVIAASVYTCLSYEAEQKLKGALAYLTCSRGTLMELLHNPKVPGDTG